MKTGETLLRWTRSMYMEWWEKRHDAQREPPDELLARVYLQGGIDALNDEIERQLTMPLEQLKMKQEAVRQALALKEGVIR